MSQSPEKKHAIFRGRGLEIGQIKKINDLPMQESTLEDNKQEDEIKYNLEVMPKKGDRWVKQKSTVKGTFTPCMREGCTATKIHEELVYVFGGIGAGSIRYNECFTINVLTNEWSLLETKDTVPLARNNHSAVAIKGGDEIYFYGGEGAFVGKFCTSDVRTPRVVFGDVWSLNTKTKLWKQVEVEGSYPERMMPVPRRGHSATLINENDILVFGGSGPEPMKGRDRYFDESWILDIGKSMWSKVKTNGTPPSPRALHTETLIDNKLYIIGGTNDHECFADVFCLDTLTFTWTSIALANKGPLPLHAHCAHLNPWYNNRIVVFGGKTKGTSLANTKMWYLNVDKNIWEARMIKGDIPAAHFSSISWVSNTNKEISKSLGGSVKGYYELDIYTLSLHAPPILALSDQEESNPDGGIGSFDILSFVSKWKKNKEMGKKPESPPDTGGSLSTYAFIEENAFSRQNEDSDNDEKSDFKPPISYNDFKLSLSSSPLKSKGRKKIKESSHIEINADPWGLEWEKIKTESEIKGFLTPEMMEMENPPNPAQPILTYRNIYSSPTSPLRNSTSSQSIEKVGSTSSSSSRVKLPQIATKSKSRSTSPVKNVQSSPSKASVPSSPTNNNNTNNNNSNNNNSDIPESISIAAKLGDERGSQSSTDFTKIKWVPPIEKPLSIAQSSKRPHSRDIPIQVLKEKSISRFNEKQQFVEHSNDREKNVIQSSSNWVSVEFGFKKETDDRDLHSPK